MDQYFKKHGEAFISGFLPRDKGDMAHLSRLVIPRESTGKGIGTSLLSAFVNEAILSGACGIDCVVGNSMTDYTDPIRLENFYKKNGFNKVGDNLKVFLDLTK